MQVCLEMLNNEIAQSIADILLKKRSILKRNVNVLWPCSQSLKVHQIPVSIYCRSSE